MEKIFSPIVEQTFHGRDLEMGKLPNINHLPTNDRNLRSPPPSRKKPSPPPFLRTISLLPSSSSSNTRSVGRMISTHGPEGENPPWV